MVFNTSTFIVFFIIFYLSFWTINNKFNYNLRNTFTIAASYVFYGWWDWRFLSLIIISSLSDYLIGKQIYSSNNKKNKKRLLLLSVGINLGILGFFKYFNFFISGLEDILSISGISFKTNTLNIILPVGISFYTFQTMSYTIDIYKNRLKPNENIISFFAFVSFFPQLVAGPIERASNLLKQFNEKKKFSYNQTVEGLRITLYGFFKKIVIADNFALIVDYVFNPQYNAGYFSTVIGTILFSFQIYCDFSGYSDIAIGISKMLGFDLMKNFKTPYFSKSFSEFWQRWHISLSTWFRDYLYIPIGGNRKSLFRSKLNLLITFLVSGLWHGANITFVIWGFLHGLLLIGEKSIKKIRFRLPSIIIVFIIVSFLWLPFRAEDFSHLTKLLKSFSIQENPAELINRIISFFTLKKVVLLSIVFILFILVELKIGTNDFNSLIKSRKPIIRNIVYFIILISILILGNFNAKPAFIYFQF